MTRALLALLLVACASEEPMDTAFEAPETPADVYARACSYCHADDGRGTNLGPDLRERTADMSVDDVAEVVLYGSGFMDPIRLDPEEAREVAEYVLEMVGD